jgi:hypothetical protein
MIADEITCNRLALAAAPPMLVDKRCTIYNNHPFDVSLMIMILIVENTYSLCLHIPHDESIPLTTG